MRNSESCILAAPLFQTKHFYLLSNYYNWHIVRWECSHCSRKLFIKVHDIFNVDSEEELPLVSIVLQLLSNVHIISGQNSTCRCRCFSVGPLE